LVAEQVGEAMQQARDRWLEAPHLVAHGPLDDVDLAGRRVVVSFDGGRLQERVPHAGRPKNNGHRDYEGRWIEPRQLVIYALDDQGRLDRAFGRVAEATLGEAEEVMALLGKLVRALKIAQAAQVILVCDGLRWQWPRLRGQLVAAGVDPARIVEVVDRGHAHQRLYKLADLPRDWGQPRRVRWVLRAKKLLGRGDIDGLLEHIETMARGRRAKQVRDLAGYFEFHRQRMRYAAFEAMAVPISSGVVESMIRQVVNLRLKGSGKFWRREMAELMLMMRAWLKADRFQALYRFTLRERVGWWYTFQAQHSCDPARAAA
jgi:hypothetical protein